MDPDQTARMLVANALCWFCRDAAQILRTPYLSIKVTLETVIKLTSLQHNNLISVHEHALVLLLPWLPN
jgi:hypothetical protein